MIELEIIEELVSSKLAIDIRKRTRKRDYVIGRIIFFSVARGLLNKRVSLHRLGDFLGKRDHATVLNALNNFDIDVKPDDFYFKTYLNISKTAELIIFKDAKSDNKRELHLKVLDMRYEIMNLRRSLIQKENDEMDDNPFLQEIKDLTPEQFKVFKERAEVMIKSVKRLNVAY